MTIDDFIARLEEYRSSGTVFNMYYGNSKSAIECRKNLKQYLEKHKNAKILLVGEAPGYNGCAKTGVPFTSNTNEPSSKVIQDFLTKELANPTDVLMWNAFPFHPHEKGKKNSNRKPNSDELLTGRMYLNALMYTFPDVICFGAIGRVAEKSLKEASLYYAPVYIRHPSFGGKKKCEEDLARAFKEFGKNIEDHDKKVKKYGKWPKEITEKEHEEYLDKIKLEYIRSVKCERNDPYYDSVCSPWMMWMRLDVFGQRVRVFISDNSKYYKKILDMLDKSGEFNYESQVPKMYGQFEYTRKER